MPLTVINQKNEELLKSRQMQNQVEKMESRSLAEAGWRTDRKKFRKYACVTNINKEEKKLLKSTDEELGVKYGNSNLSTRSRAHHTEKYRRYYERPWHKSEITKAGDDSKKLRLLSHCPGSMSTSHPVKTHRRARLASLNFIQEPSNETKLLALPFCYERKERRTDNKEKGRQRESIELVVVDGVPQFYTRERSQNKPILPFS